MTQCPSANLPSNQSAHADIAASSCPYPVVGTVLKIFDGADRRGLTRGRSRKSW